VRANLNNVQPPDEYEDGATIRVTGATALFLSVSNQAVYVQFGYGPAGGAPSWDDEEMFRPPGIYQLDVECDAVRFRAALPEDEIPAPLKPAQITASLE